MREDDMVLTVVLAMLATAGWEYGVGYRVVAVGLWGVVGLGLL